MKKLISLLLRLLTSPKQVRDTVDDKTWEHLDGAEFFVVFPKPRVDAPAE